MKTQHAPAALLLCASLLLAPAGRARRAAGPGPAAAAACAAESSRPRSGSPESEPAVRVAVDAERNVYVGKEQAGTCDDVGPLKERVRQAVRRNRRAARARGGKEAARSAGTVFICVTQDAKYGDVVKVIDAVKAAGGGPVGLETRDDCKPR